jgi:hypothetical protein
MSYTFKPLQMKRMRKAKAVYAAGMLLWCASISVMAQEWVAVKDATETRTLLSNKTLSGQTRVAVLVDCDNTTPHVKVGQQQAVSGVEGRRNGGRVGADTPARHGLN